MKSHLTVVPSGDNEFIDEVVKEILNGREKGPTHQTCSPLLLDTILLLSPTQRPYRPTIRPMATLLERIDERAGKDDVHRKLLLAKAGQRLYDEFLKDLGIS